MNIETHFAEQLVKFQKKFELHTVYSNPYHTAFSQTKEIQENKSNASGVKCEEKVLVGITKTK